MTGGRRYVHAIAEGFPLDGGTQAEPGWGVCSKNEQDRPIVCNHVAAGLTRPSFLFAGLTKPGAEPGLTSGASGRTPAGIAPDRLACCLLTVWVWEGRRQVGETVAAIVEAHRSGATSPEATVARTYARIRAHGDPAVFISLRAEAQAIAAAKALAARGE